MSTDHNPVMSIDLLINECRLLLQVDNGKNLCEFVLATKAGAVRIDAHQAQAILLMRQALRP